MGKDADWTAKYLGSDHHTDRYVGTIVRYEDKTGLEHQEPCRVVDERLKNRAIMMGYNDGRRRRAASMAYGELDDDDMYSRPGVFPGARQALVISNKVIDDGNFRSSVSSRKDQMLLNDITAKLHNIEMDEVRPGYDVALRTGGYRRPKRRQKKGSSGEPADRSDERKDELRYPRNYTAALACNHQENNINSDYNPRRWEVPESCMDVHHQRPYGDAYYNHHHSHDDDYYDEDGDVTRNVNSRSDEMKLDIMELLAKSRSVFAPIHEDKDDFIPKPSRPIADYQPYVSRYQPGSVSYDQIEPTSNPRISQKIADASRDIDEFEAMLEDRFRKSSVPARSQPSDVQSTPMDYPPVVDDTQAQADISQPVTVRPSARRHAVRQTVSRPFVGRVAMINSYDTVPDDLVYRRRVMTRACSVPPSPVLSAARYDYIPLSTSRIPLETRRRRCESVPPASMLMCLGDLSIRPSMRGMVSYQYPAEDMMLSRYGRAIYSAPANVVSQRIRHSYRETTPEHVPAYSMNNLRRRTIDARNKLDVHRTLLDRYMPDTFEADQDVGSAIMHKYGELVDRARRLGRKSQTLGNAYVRSYAARSEIPSILPIIRACSPVYYY